MSKYIITLFLLTISLSSFAVNLEWFPIKGVSKYKIEISKDRNFQNLLQAQIINKNSYIYIPESLGLIFWRVQGLGKNKLWGAYSDPEEIKVLKKPKEILINFAKPKLVGSACRMEVDIVLDGEKLRTQPGMFFAIKQDKKLYKFKRWSVNLTEKPIKIYKKFKYYLVQGRTILTKRTSALTKSFQRVESKRFKEDIEKLIDEDPGYELIAVYDEENDKRYNDLKWIYKTYQKEREFKVYYKGPDCGYYQHTYIPETNNFDFRAGLYYANVNYEMDSSGIPSAVQFKREESTAGIMVGSSYIPARDLRYVDEISLDLFMNYNFSNTLNNLTDVYLKIIKKNVFDYVIMGVDGHAMRHYIGFEQEGSTKLQPTTDYHAGPFFGVSKSFMDYKLKLYGGYLGLLATDNSTTWYVKGHYEKLTGRKFGVEFRYYNSSIPVAINLPSSALNKKIVESIFSLGMYYIF